MLSIQQRAKTIRKATPNGQTLENLFEMQNRICDLCGHPIQDLICAALDHSTPIIYFARLNVPIAEAAAQANDLKNLRCAHASCNHAKWTRTREEWFARGLNERDKPQLMTESELITFRLRLGAGGRNGKKTDRVKQGRRLRDQRVGWFSRTPEQHSRDSKKGGLRAAASAKTRGTGLFSMTREQHVQNGQKVGRQNVKLRRGFWKLTKAERRDLGQRAVDSGLLARNRAQMHPLSGTHARWHVRRGIPNPDCVLCRPAPEN
jgi:hypothetical protein